MVQGIERIKASRNPRAAQLVREYNEVEDPGTYAPPVGSECLDREEWERILALGIQHPPSDEDVARMSYEEIDAVAHEGGFRLRPLQAWMIREFDATKGLLAQARVGTGKTLATLMLAGRAARLGLHPQVISVPASVYRQLWEVDLPRYRAKVPLGTTFHGLGGLSKAARLNAAKRHRSGCFIIPYSLLSREETRELLMLIRPKIWIADEAHNLKRRSAARTKRFLDLMKELDDCLFVAMSGTLTAKSLHDYHHLARLALRERAPLPTGAMAGAAWAQILDSTAEASLDRASALQPLRVWADSELGVSTPYTIDGFREAYQARLSTAPGCVMSKADDLDVELQIDAVDPGEPGEKLLKLMQQVAPPLMLDPSGEDISHAMMTHKWLYELSAGFYYELLWPEPRDAAHKIAIDRARIHHGALQLYNRELRRFLEATSRPGLDTPFLVGGAIHRAELGQSEALKLTKGLPRELVRCWKEAKSLEFEGMPERIQRPVRVDDYKIQAAVKWAQEHCEKEGGILWFHHREPLEWCAAALRQVLGPRARTALAQDNAIMDPANRHLVFCASRAAHGVGKNLQHFRHQLVFQWPRPAIDAEQMLGRCHRYGVQDAFPGLEEMKVSVLLGPTFDHMNFSACAADAMYIWLTTGNAQKMLSAVYLNPPRIYDPRLLGKLGFQGKMADADAMQDKFGELAQARR